MVQSRGRGVRTRSVCMTDDHPTGKPDMAYPRALLQSMPKGMVFSVHSDDLPQIICGVFS